VLEAYLSISERDGYAWLVFGDIMKTLYRFAAAQEAYAKALALAPVGKEYLAELRLAMLENRCGNYEMAEEWYLRAFARPEMHTESMRWPYVLRGDNFLSLGRLTDAERIFHEATALESDPSDLDEAWHMFGVSLALQGKYEAARAAIEAAVKCDPTNSKSQELLCALSLIPRAELLAANALASRWSK